MLEDKNCKLLQLSSPAVEKGCESSGQKKKKKKSSTSTSTGGDREKSSRGSTGEKKAEKKPHRKPPAEARRAGGGGDEELCARAKESLRWEGVLQDPQAEAQRLERYRAGRRLRYAAHREAVLRETHNTFRQTVSGEQSERSGCS
ncbi:protein LIAT1 [Salarias fasciatus]|uniref:protein LIAT1 n=1 Tax=Salarias fasciatus TaxID=181472 RepID=UPI0011769964|nr:protein LIAT1 [Salarias fasciatus]